MQLPRTVYHTKARGSLVDLPNLQPVSHLNHARSCPPATSPNGVLEPSTTQSQHVVVATSNRVRSLFSPSLWLFAALLTPVAVLAGVLGVWRLGADPGWTNQFFIANGLLSHWQAWFAVAIGVHTSARNLKKWLELQGSVAESVAATRKTSRAITTLIETPVSVLYGLQLAELASGATDQSILALALGADRP